MCVCVFVLVLSCSRFAVSSLSVWLYRTLTRWCEFVWLLYWESINNCSTTHFIFFNFPIVFYLGLWFILMWFRRCCCLCLFLLFLVLILFHLVVVLFDSFDCYCCDLWKLHLPSLVFSMHILVSDIFLSFVSSPNCVFSECDCLLFNGSKHFEFRQAKSLHHQNRSKFNFKLSFFSRFDCGRSLWNQSFEIRYALRAVEIKPMLCRFKT